MYAYKIFIEQYFKQYINKIMHVFLIIIHLQHRLPEHIILSTNKVQVISAM